MKYIGQKKKKKREENGVSVEEAAEDLNMRPSQIESLEEGRREDFKDVMSLKYFIRDYAKYLGLDVEKMIDEFNEYLFDFTSKIPLEDIEKIKEAKTSEKAIASPYTRVENGNNKSKTIIIAIIVIIVLLVVGYLIASGIKGNSFKDSGTAYTIRR